MKTINYLCIIDDDPIMVFGIRKMLETVANCNDVRSFVNGQLAIDEIKTLLNSNQPIPEVIFLDINMPIMDGWQFLQEFINLPIKKSIRINIITSSIDTVDYEIWKSFKSQTHHVLTYNNKPLSKANLSKILAAA